MESENSKSAGGAGGGPRAILWLTAGSEPPRELVAAISRGNLGVEPVTSPYLALAHLCHLERTADDNPRTAAAALVLVSPERLACPGQVCEAAAKYAPRSRVWLYEPGTNRGLRAVVQEDVDGWLKSPGSIDAKPVVVQPGRPARPGANPQPLPLRTNDSRTHDSRAQAAAGAGSAPKLRLAGEGGVQDGEQSADHEDSGEGAPRPRQMLTSEELEMLLDDREPS